MTIRGMIIVALIIVTGLWLINMTRHVGKLLEPRLPTLELIRQIEACDKMGGYPLFEINGRREASSVTCRVLVGD